MTNSPTSTAPRESVSGIEALAGVGAREPLGFWGDVFSQVLRRPGAVMALIWVSIVALIGAYAPFIASGHPLVARDVVNGVEGGAYSPLLERLSANDWLLALGIPAAVVLLALPLGVRRSDRLKWVLAAAFQAGMTAFVAHTVQTVFEGRNASEWMRQLEQGPGFAALATAVSGAVVGALCMLIASTRSAWTRLIVVGVGFTAAFFAVTGTWDIAPARFQYREAEQAGTLRATYTIIPFSPTQRAGDRDAKLQAPGTAYDASLADIVTQRLPREPGAVLGADEMRLIADRIKGLPIEAARREDLSESVALEASNASGLTRSELNNLLERALATRGPRYLLGTDALGQDVASQLVHASRLAVSIGLVSTGIAVTIGVLIGALMGYFGGLIDLLLYRVVEVFMSVPVLFLLIVSAGVLPPEARTTYTLMVIIGLFTWHGAARFTRAEFLKLRNQDFVQAARATGLPLRSILFRHMLPNGVTPVLVDASFLIASAILAEATLSYLGLGPADQPSWGKLLSSAIGEVGDFVWWLSIFPGLAIFLTVLSYNLVGEAMRDAIDPKLKKAAVI